MDTLNWILAGLLTALLGLVFLKTRQLEKLLADRQSDMEDLSFRHGEASDFIQNQIAKTHYQMLARVGRLKFTPDTSLAQALSHEGARDILVKHKLIKRNNAAIPETSLARQAKALNIPLEPALADLNILETLP
jgi:hypothetical protein